MGIWRPLRQHARVVAGDMCGAYSVPTYARRKQRFVSEFDHPKFDFPSADTIRAINRQAFEALLARTNSMRRAQRPR